MGFCKKCGRKIEEDSHFCPQCGEKLLFNSKETIKPKINDENLLYVECPNCAKAFNSQEVFRLSKDFWGNPKFLCLHCHRIFNYPISVNFGVQIVFGIIIFFISLSISDTTIQEDPLKAGIALILWFMGIGIFVQGLIALHRNNKLKSQTPSWENRFHNTIKSKKSHRY